MLRSRIPRLVIVVASVTALVGCSASASAPVTDIERSEIRQQLLDAKWQSVSMRYPTVVRPVVSIEGTVDDPDVENLVAECIDDAGYVVAGESLLVLDENQTVLGFALARYSCDGMYPALSDVTALLSDDQVGSLFDYYANSVRPCLTGLGLPTTTPPERGFFVDSYGFGTWNPFDLVRTPEQPSTALSVALSRCPPVPDWLDLATDGAW